MILWLSYHCELRASSIFGLSDKSFAQRPKAAKLCHKISCTVGIPAAARAIDND